jgi:aminotransferase EvaB
MKLDILGVNDLSRHIHPLRDELKAAAARVVDSAWFVMGSEVEKFESSFGSYCGVENCIGVANGTDALELALRSIGVKAGALIATVANAGMYSTTAILALGAIPVYVDIDPSTHTMSLVDLEKAISTHSISAVIVTHLYGRMADMFDVMKIANVANIPVIEDCAQAHGATLDGRKAGSFGTVGTFSFYPTKNLGALGDAGAVVTRVPDIAQRVRYLRQYGWTKRYCAEVPGGRNSRLDELQAAFLNIMLPRLDDWNDRRRQIARLYSTSISNRRVRVRTKIGLEDVAHLYVVQVDDRDGLRKHLSQFKCPTDVHYPIPDYRQAAVSSICGPLASLEITERACAEIVTLPCFPELKDEEVSYIADRINEW